LNVQVTVIEYGILIIYARLINLINLNSITITARFDDTADEMNYQCSILSIRTSVFIVGITYRAIISRIVIRERRKRYIETINDIFTCPSDLIND
jgi:hypothetical protein